MTLVAGFDTIRPLWAHQVQALKMASGKRDFALFFEPGCGKTLTAIAISRFKMFMKRRPLRTLVICPPIVVKNWREEWLASSHFNEKEVVCLLGSGAKRKKTLEQSSDFAKVVIMNYESLLMKPLMQEVRNFAPEIIIFDESHRCKSYQAKRTKESVLLAASDSVLHRFILTGTPVLNTPLDLFSQFQILDTGETFGKSYFKFRNTYFVDKNMAMPAHVRFPNWVIRKAALEEITEKIESKSLFVEKRKCLDLPPLVKKTVPCALTGEQKRVYEEMKKDFLALVGEKVAVAQLALTKALRLMQIVSGFLTVEDMDGNETTHVFDCERPKILKELLTDLEGQKVIVWANWRHNYGEIAKVCDSLKLPYVEIHGGISEKKKFENVDAFNNDERIKVCIGHPASGGIGINLVAASTAIFYSRGFSLENDIQAEARNYRGGSEVHKKITRVDIVTENTIDEAIMKTLAAKQAVSDKVLFDLAKEF